MISNYSPKDIFMSKEIKVSRFANAAPMGMYGLVAILLFAVNLYIYQFAPFEGMLNDTIVNVILAISALMVAVTATAIFLHYHPEDFPRKIWLYMMLGCWSWFLAEMAWAAISFVSVEVPAPDIPDVGWVGGFIFFTIAFYHQYAAILPTQKKRIITSACGAWALAIFIPLFILLVTRTFTAESYINYYYPIADLALGVSGISLMFVFRGGALMRPWFGLFFFGISDIFYAWAVQTGLYEWSAQNSDALTTTIDSMYLASYLFFGIGLASHWALITYGLRGER
jgi:hypothetical protein